MSHSIDINYELYKVFYYVATTLSFSAASKRLFISQSAVSQSIKTLESKLNQPLFVRSTKKVSLTVEGEMLLQHVEPAMNLIKKGETQLLETLACGGGQLRIGSSDTICRYFLVPFLKRFHEEFPKVHIKVMNQPSLKCVDLLESGQVDLIVTNFPNPRLQDMMHSIPISDFQDVFIANRNYFQLEHESISLKALQKYPLLMLDRQSTTSQYLHSLFLHYQLDLVPEIELSSNDLLIDLANIGLGIAFIPDYCLPNMKKDLFVVTLKEKLAKRQLAIVISEKKPLSKPIRAFIDYFSTSSNQN